MTLPWAREYAFDEAYAKSNYDVAALTGLAGAIGSNTAIRDQYFGYTSSGNAKSTADTLATWKGYWCGLTAMTESAFTKCYCTAAPKP